MIAFVSLYGDVEARARLLPLRCVRACTEAAISVPNRPVVASIPDFQDPQLQETNAVLSIHPVHGTLLWQPKLTKTIV